MNVPRLPLPSARSRPPRPGVLSQSGVNLQPTQQKTKVPVLEKNLIDQLSQEEQDSLSAKFKDAIEANKKALPFTSPKAFCCFFSSLLTPLSCDIAAICSECF